jgi:hypothetical protein
LLESHEEQVEGCGNLFPAQAEGRPLEPAALDLLNEYLASLSALMPRRIAAVIKNGGDLIKY